MQWRRKLEKFEGDGTKNLGLREALPPWRLISFGRFVYCLWTTLLFFLSLSLFFSPIFLPPRNCRGKGTSPSLKILDGEMFPVPRLPSPASAACGSMKNYLLSTVDKAFKNYLLSAEDKALKTYLLSVADKALKNYLLPAVDDVLKNYLVYQQ